MFHHDPTRRRVGVRTYPPRTQEYRPPMILSRSIDSEPPQEGKTAEAADTEVTEPPPGSTDVSPPSSPTDEGDETAADSAGHTLPLDQIFEILKNSRRRETLAYLKENGGETTLSEVAEHIAAIENDTTINAISSAERKRVYVGLYQCHLPKMDDTNVVQFDKNRGTIALGPNAEQLEPYLEEPSQQSWHKLYLGVTVAGAGLFVLGQAGAASYGLTPSVVLVLLLVGITGCGIVHSRKAKETAN